MWHHIYDYSNVIKNGCNKHKTLLSNFGEISEIVVRARWTIICFIHFEACRNV